MVILTFLHCHYLIPFILLSIVIYNLNSNIKNKLTVSNINICLYVLKNAQIKNLLVTPVNFFKIIIKKLLSNYLSIKNVIIRGLLGNKLVFIIDCLWSDLTKNPLLSPEEKLDFALNRFYINLYKDTKDINSFKFYLLALFIYSFSNDTDIFYLYVSKLSFFMAISIDLIFYNKFWMDNSLMKENFPIFHSIIKGLLLVLLLLVLYLSIETVQCIVVYIIKSINCSLFKVKILDKLKDLKSSFFSKNPKNPKDPSGIVLSPDNPKKPKKKALDFYGDEVDLHNVNQENKDKAKSLKEAILQKKIERIYEDSPRAKFQENNALTIKWVKDSKTLEDHLKKVTAEHEAYTKQAVKFQDHINVIESRNAKGFITEEEGMDEVLYPAEATKLFKDYVVLVNILKDNLEPIKKNLEKEVRNLASKNNPK